jgi:membrane protease YdiL (CAAX protease family)
MTQRLAFLAMLIFVLLLSRIAVELSVRFLPLHLAWVAAFAVYYAAMSACYVVAVRKYGMPRLQFIQSLRPMPTWPRLVFGIVLIGLSPAMALVTHASQLTAAMWISMATFALINPFFEEGFWRGVMHHLPAPLSIRIIYSAVLFSFGHWLLWAKYWMSDPYVWVPMIVATLLMGVGYSWFYARDKRLIYPVLSHMSVDFLNMAAAVYSGLQLHTH